MKLLRITERLLDEVLNSMVIEDDVASLVDIVLQSHGNSKVEFIHYALSMCSNNYYREDSVGNPLDMRERSYVSSIVRGLKLTDESQVLVGDRIDLLYASDPDHYSEYTKFNYHFYSSIEGLFFGQDELLDSDLYTDVIETLERLVSLVEQMIILATTDEILDSLVVLIVTNPNPDMYILVH